MILIESGDNFASVTQNNITLCHEKITLFLTLISSLHAAGQSGIQDSIPAQELNEVIVRGERPQIKGHDGVLTVDLPAIVREKPVTNVLEALSYLPGVVDNNGSIGLSGATSVTIILNGELTNMPVQNLYQLLYSTPVDRLKNVEIMYAAPAKYHVSGAVINIVLKTPRPLDGLTRTATGRLYTDPLSLIQHRRSHDIRIERLDFRCQLDTFAKQDL